MFRESPTGNTRSKVEVTGPEIWTWERDGRSIVIKNVYTVKINQTPEGETTLIEIHFVIVEDGTYRWLTDCGKPLPKSFSSF
jgi:hypothetical protein